MAEEVDVLVIGGGISGLIAAYRLQQEQQQQGGGENVRKVVVLEGRDRVGGRTHTLKKEGGFSIDVGGAYIGPTQENILRLAEELGVETYKIYTQGQNIHCYNGKNQTYYGLIPPMSILALVDANDLAAKIDELSRRVPLDAPWEAPEAELWDNMTVAEWLTKNSWTKEAAWAVSVSVHIIFCVGTSELSFLYFLSYIRASGGFRRIAQVEDGAQERKFVGGAQEISNRLMKLLGDNVRLLHEVVRVEQATDSYLVSCTNGASFKAKRVTVALPPYLYQKIHFNPSLPPSKNELSKRMPLGTIIKTTTTFKTPFWRDLGFSGQALSDEGPVYLCYDDVKPDGSHPALMGFVVSRAARDVADLTMESRKKLVLDHYARIFGTKAAYDVVDYTECNWGEERLSAGCYVATMGPSILTSVGRNIRAPVGGIFFAGTETATRWIGYMDGAVQSGERAATEVLLSFGVTPSRPFNRHTLPPDPVPTPLLDQLTPSVPTFLALAVASGALFAYNSYKHLWPLCKGLMTSFSKS